VRRVADLDAPEQVGHTRLVRSPRLRTLALGLLVLLVAALCGVAIREVWSLAESG